ncbi:MAG TPA: hypothetical protein VG122_21655 [Gemmata sp.]|jgi:hypothetical protein|nr:hypothetical protein [Gemmata sp.]
MPLTSDRHAPLRRLLPGEGCVEFPLLLLDEHLTELEQKAMSEKRTIGQMIRQAIGQYVTRAAEPCGTDDKWADSQLDTPSDMSGSLVVTLLLPVSRLEELESIATQVDTTASALIRRVVCYSLLGRSSVQQLTNKL